MPGEQRHFTGYARVIPNIQEEGDKIKRDILKFIIRASGSMLSKMV
jgi:hypothetical protein